MIVEDVTWICPYCGRWNVFPLPDEAPAGTVMVETPCEACWEGSGWEDPNWYDAAGNWLDDEGYVR